MSRFAPRRTPITVRPEVTENLSHTWAHLARPGATWTGAQRVFLAAEARRSRADEPPAHGLPPAAIDAARLLAAEPAAISRSRVEGLVTAGLGYERYVEMIGVVSQVVAADTFAEALGLAPAPLPEPGPGEPTGETQPAARLEQAWVPMVGGRSIAQALSLVPAENAAVERFHAAMYLPFGEISNPAFARTLTRPQMELLAARTSWRNACFYCTRAHARMLGWSAESAGVPVDLTAVTDPAVDPLLPGGVALLRFADAVLDRSAPATAAATSALREELGDEATADAATVVANFQMMNRVAHGSGMPVNEATRRRDADLIARLGLERIDNRDDPEESL